MTDALQRLLERLQTGWSPRADEIDPAVPQHDLIDWAWFRPVPEWDWVLLFSDREDADQEMTTDVLWFDRHLSWALTNEAFYWLYDAEEGAKMRYLGG